MKLYHGSPKIIGQPQYGEGKPYNDYGLGFYCTEVMDLAREWSVSGTQGGFVNCYEFERAGMDVLDLNQSQYCMLHWLCILLQNRTFSTQSPLAAAARDYICENFQVDYKDRDVIIGYRADDSYFSYAQDFLNGTISYRQLYNAMYLGKLGQQFVLKSEAAFGCIQFIGSVTVDHRVWYPKKLQRDKEARAQYLDVDRFTYRKGDIYITKIMDEEMTSDELRL